MRVEPYGGRPEEWDRFVRGQEGYTHFHEHGWKQVIERVFAHECLYFAARDDAGVLVGALPLVRIRSALFGHYLVSMPFVSYGGPLGSAQAVSALVEHVAAIARREKVKLLELRSRIPLSMPLPVSHRKITLLLDLPAEGPQELWDRLGTKMRTKVRRSLKEGLAVSFGRDQVGPFFRVFSRHMRDLGTPTLPRLFFEALSEAFAEDTWFGCVYHEGRAVAGGCGLRWGSEFEMTWSSALPEYKHLKPNLALFWAFMERAAQEGLKTFNFGRSTPGSGTHLFKMQWGSREEPLWWYGLSDREGVTTPTPEKGPYSWGPRIWKLLPASIATALGPRLSRHLP